MVREKYLVPEPGSIVDSACMNWRNVCGSWVVLQEILPFDRMSVYVTACSSPVETWCAKHACFLALNVEASETRHEAPVVWVEVEVPMI